MTLGACDRLAIAWPPQHGKTFGVTVHYPLWRMLREPGLRAGVVTHSQRYANKISKWVRGVVRRSGLGMGSVSKADEWELANGSTFLARGVGGMIAGEPLDLVVLDDPFGSREDADSVTIQEKVYEYYMDDLTPRVQQGGAVVLIHCLTGDTPVTMTDGTRRRLETIRPGDEVLGWENGRAVSRRVLNFAPQGEDDVYEINTGNHKVRANARHPFLADRGGRPEWVAVSQLSVGDRLVSSGLETHAETWAPRLTRGEAWLLGFMFGDGWVTAGPKSQRKPSGTISTSMRYVTCCATSRYPELDRRVLDQFERVFGAAPKPTQYGYVRSDIADVGRWFLSRGLVGKAKTKRLPPWIFAEPLENREAFVLGFAEADGHLVEKYARRTVGASNLELIQDVRHLARSCGHKVTNIHEERFRTTPPHSAEPVDGYTARVSWSEPARTTEPFATVAVRSITPVGRAEVFDIQVEGAESFVADGLVVHNTRWGPGDLIGRILESEEGPEWRYVRLPAIAEENDPIGRAAGAALCEDRFPLEKLLQKRRVEGVGFESLYQQNPVPRGGTFFRREWFGRPVDGVPTHPPLKPPRRVRYWDLAASRKDTACYTAGVLMARQGDTYYVEDVVRGRWNPAERNEVMLQTAVADKTRPGFERTWFENPVFDKGGDAKRGVIAKLAGHPVAAHDVGGAGSKEVRAEPFADAAKGGLVRLVAGPWVAAFLTELESFPKGAYKDQVDSSSAAFSMLTRGGLVAAFGGSPATGR